MSFADPASTAAAAQAPGAADARPDAALEHARRLLRSTPLIDGHNDLAWEIRESKTAPRDVKAYDLRAKTPGHTDLARLALRRGCAQARRADNGFHST